MKTTPSASIDFTATTSNGKSSLPIDSSTEVPTAFSASLRSAMPQEKPGEISAPAPEQAVRTNDSIDSDIEPTKENWQSNQIPTTDPDYPEDASATTFARPMPLRIDQAKEKHSHRHDENTDLSTRHKKNSTDAHSGREELSIKAQQSATESSERMATVESTFPSSQDHGNDAKPLANADGGLDAIRQVPPGPDSSLAAKGEAAKGDTEQVDIGQVIPNQKKGRSLTGATTNTPAHPSTHGANSPASNGGTEQTAEQLSVTAGNNQTAKSLSAKNASSADQTGQRAGPIRQVQPNDRTQAATLTAGIESSETPRQNNTKLNGLASERTSRTRPGGPESLKQQLAKRADATDREQSVSGGRSEPLTAARADSMPIRLSSIDSTGLNDIGTDRLGLAAAQHQASGLTGASADMAAASSLPDIDTPLNPENVSEAFQGQLGERLLMAVRQDMTRAEIRITPNELGPITIELVVEGNTAAISFGAENANTRNALNDSLSSLREQLAREGLSLGETSVGEQANRSSDQRDRQQQTSQWTELRGDNSALTGEPPLPAVYRPPAAARGLVDLFA